MRHQNGGPVRPQPVEHRQVSRHQVPTDEVFVRPTEMARPDSDVKKDVRQDKAIVAVSAIAACRKRRRREVRHPSTRRRRRRLAEVHSLGLSAPPADGDRHLSRRRGRKRQPPRGGHRQSGDFGDDHA